MLEPGPLAILVIVATCVLPIVAVWFTWKTLATPVE